MKDPKIMEYMLFAEHLAKQAGEMIKKNFRLGMRKDWKEDNTPVTATDMKFCMISCRN